MMKKKRNLEGNRLQHFELSDKNRTVRWIFIIILMIVAGVALTIGMMGVLKTPDGWDTVEVNSVQLNCGSEFILHYEYGAGEKTATDESKALQVLYGETVEDAWKLFFNEAGVSDLKGIYEINRHPNEEVTVDSGLYRALEQVVNSGSRALYLAPVYAEYNRVFYSEGESFARQYDPGQNDDQRAYVKTLADFANDPQAVQLVLIGNNKVMLRASREYLDFAKQNELTRMVDFGWLRNAFIADYIASELTENGFTNGYISSADGFTRNLDLRGNTYSLSLFNRSEEGIEAAAVMDYTAPKSMVFLRSYPIHAADSQRYYRFSNGRIVTMMIDPADGQSKAATDNLVAYSTRLGCGELVLSVMPVYVADTLSEDALNALTEQDIYSVWFSGRQLMHNQEDLRLTVYEPYYTN